MTSATAIDLVRTLAQAWRSGQPVDATPWAATLPDAAAAYAAQRTLVAALEASGPVPGVRCWKSGGASRDSVLTHAPLPAGGVRHSPASCADLSLSRRGIEAEIALRLARDVTAQDAADLQADDTSALVDAMAVAIEVVDSRWAQGPQAPALLRLADLQSHGALVLGDWVPFEPRDWSLQRCEVRIGAAQPRPYVGTHSLRDPAWLLPTWLRHATRDGATVPAGTVVTTGTWCGLLDAAAGDAVCVRFDGIGEARLQF